MTGRFNRGKLDFDICTMEIHAAMTIGATLAAEIETFDFLANLQRHTIFV